MKRSELSWPELNRLATGLALLGGSAMSFCFCLNLLSLDDLAGFLTSNELSFARRNWFLATMGRPLCFQHSCPRDGSRISPLPSHLAPFGTGVTALHP